MTGCWDCNYTAQRSVDKQRLYVRVVVISKLFRCSSLINELLVIKSLVYRLAQVCLVIASLQREPGRQIYLISVVSALVHIHGTLFLRATCCLEGSQNINQHQHLLPPPLLTKQLRCYVDKTLYLSKLCNTATDDTIIYNQLRLYVTSTKQTYSLQIKYWTRPYIILYECISRQE